MPNPSELHAKIQELEKRVKELEKALADYTDIENYYLQKYQEIFEDTRRARAEEIKQELENMTLEISNLKKEKEDLTDALEENVIIERGLKEIDIHLSELYKLTETSSLDAESEINDLEQIGLQTLEQHKEQINKYAKKIDKLLTPPFITENIIFLTNALMDYLKGEGFTCIKTQKENDRKVKLIKKYLGDKNKEYQQTIAQLVIDRESLLAKYREIENEDINRIQDEITSFMIHQEKYFDEMMASLEQIKEKHENIITEEVKKYTVWGYSKREIGEILDDRLVVFSQELLTTDSVENKTYQKEKRLKKLQIEANRLRELDIEKETLASECRELQTKYLTMQKQVQKIEEFNIKVHDTIDYNNQYHNFAENYLSFIHFEEETMQLIANKQEAIKRLNNLNTSLENNDEVLEIEETKKQFEEEIKGLERSLEEARMHIAELRENPENEQVLKMLLAVKDYEEKLPAIYETLSVLKQQIDEKHNRLNYLKEQLVEYQSVLMQIEGLTNED